MNRIIAYISIVCATLWAATAVAQEPDSLFAVEVDSIIELDTDTICTTRRDIQSLITIDTISCVDFAADTITFNGADWSLLFRAMKQLQDSTPSEQNVISIIHLGDSHVQAGYFTEALRIPMQMMWGNAGRGLITPLKISKTNEPADYRITTPDKWQYNRCIIGKKFSSRVGVGGILIEPTSKHIDLTIETMSRYGEDVSFNRLKLFHAPTDNFPQLLLTDEPEGLTTHSPIAGETCYSWNKAINTINLQGANSYDASNASIYGAILENDRSGIIVHAIGNNSATYECYNRVEEYGQKLSRLAPQLVIISLGTNESVSSTTTRESLYRQIDCLIHTVKEHNPHTLFLLTTPADNKQRKRGRRNGRRTTYYVENNNVENVVATIKEYGVEHQIAVWDWHTIAGGKGSCTTWIKEEGMRKDHIHYTPKGYALQGNLLYRSILNAYEQYIR